MRNHSFGQKSKNMLDTFIQFLRVHEITSLISGDSLVVDLGCGYNASLLSGLSGQIKMGLGLDISVSNKNLPSNIRLCKTDLNKKILLKDDSADFVISLAVIEHLLYPENLLKEAFRILKPGGKIIITTPSTYSKPVLELLAFNLKIISKEEIEDHKRYYNKRSLADSLKKAGFKNIKIKYFELGLNLLAVASKVRS